MKNNNSNIFSELEFGHHYQLNSSSETVSPIDRRDVSSPATIATGTHISEKSIMAALGFIATLLLFSGMQLYRSLNLNPASGKITKSNLTFISKTKDFNTRNLKQEMHLKEFDNFIDLRKNEISTIQNAISQGKF